MTSQILALWNRISQFNWLLPRLQMREIMPKLSNKCSDLKWSKQSGTDFVADLEEQHESVNGNVEVGHLGDLVHRLHLRSHDLAVNDGKRIGAVHTGQQCWHLWKNAQIITVFWCLRANSISMYTTICRIGLVAKTHDLSTTLRDSLLHGQHWFHMQVSAYSWETF